MRMLDILEENSLQQNTPRHTGWESLSQEGLANGEMSDIGQSHHFGFEPGTSGLPPTPDVSPRPNNGRYVPKD
jgi:hypothetical protein